MTVVWVFEIQEDETSNYPAQSSAYANEVKRPDYWETFCEQRVLMLIMKR